jgi:sporulation protein YlmC with PRC-barrel domain
LFAVPLTADVLFSETWGRFSSSGSQYAGRREIMAFNSDRIQHKDLSTPTRRVMSAASLASDAVRNKNGEKLGSITDIIIDLPSGRVAYAVLSFGGFLGFGEKLFAIPWEALTLDEDNKWFILDVDKSALENAPGFDKDNWPDMADASWGTDIHNYYGRKPYWEKYPESYGVDSEAPALVATDEIGKQGSGEYDSNAKKL